jgi:hypothetical protein
MPHRKAAWGIAGTAAVAALSSGFTSPPAGISLGVVTIAAFTYGLVGTRSKTTRSLDEEEETEGSVGPAPSPAAPPHPEEVLRVSFLLGQRTVQSVDFGPIDTGSNKTQPIVVANSGGVPLSALEITASSDDPTRGDAFGIANDVMNGIDLQPEIGRRVDLVFTPSIQGRFSGRLIVSSPDLATSAILPIQGQGV